MTSDATPWDHIRCEVAFSTLPDDLAPAWADVTSRLRIDKGISIDRGRQDGQSAVAPGSCNFTLENLDGALTPGSGSYGVAPQNRCRLTYRDPATLGDGNLLTSTDATFEDGTAGSWTGTVAGFTAPSALAVTGTRVHSGSWSLQADWAAAVSSAVGLPLYGLVAGRQYTVAAYVYQSSTGQVTASILGGPTGTHSTFGAWTRVTVTWNAMSASDVLVLSVPSTTVGEQCWIDDVQLDEGSTLGAFTTVDMTGYLFDGYVSAWPVEWPDLDGSYSTSTVQASDLLSRLSSRRQLRSVVTETLTLDGPSAHFPLDEGDGATSVADATGTGAALTIFQQGAGVGTIAFGQGTGPATDAASAAVFTPTSTTNGLYLSGGVRPVSGAFTLEVCVATTLFKQGVAALTDARGLNGVWLSIDTTGHPIGQLVVNGVPLVAASVAASVLGGATHTIAASVSRSAGVTTLTVQMDDGTPITASTSAAPMLVVDSLAAGCAGGIVYSGTMSHVAVYPAALTSTQVTRHRVAESTGFAGESSSARLSRIASWVGVDPSLCVFDAGDTSSVAHVDCTGMSPLDYMQRIATTTEGGILYADGRGRLVFRERSVTFLPGTATSIPSYLIGQGVVLTEDTQGLVNEAVVTAASGVKWTVEDEDSQDRFGVFSSSWTVDSTSDAEALSAGQWVVYTSTPQLRLTSLPLDGTEATYGPTIRGLDVLSRVELSSMPPTVTVPQLSIQGVHDDIGPGQWDRTFNTTSVTTALVLDDPTYGVLDSTFVIAY